MQANIVVDCRNNNGFTPLMIAVYYGHLEMVKYLVTAGANINAQDNKKHTVLHVALRKNIPSGKVSCLV